MFWSDCKKLLGIWLAILLLFLLHPLLTLLLPLLPFTLSIFMVEYVYFGFMETS